jgi:D-alanyl-D-alanine carboxypeptidase
MANGSGLSWESRVSAHCFVETMEFAYGEFRVFADLLGSLPAGGETGTLKSRFKRAGKEFDVRKVRGKTGTVWSKQVATSLSGVTVAGSGEKVLFSLIENDQRNDPGLLHGLKEWEDRCVELVQQLRL